MDKTIRFTRHAKNRMRLHRISEKDVLLVLESPDFSESDAGDHLNIWKKMDDRYIRVTVNEEHGQVIVITAVKKKRGWK